MNAITLTVAEQRLAVYLAKTRCEHDARIGARPTLYAAGADLIQNTTESIGAELAFCRLMNVYPDLDNGNFAAADALLRDGRSVDVKHNPRPAGRLLVKIKRRAELPDLYALMVGRFPTYRLAGFIAASEMLRDERIDASLPHPAYAARQDELG